MMRNLQAVAVGALLVPLFGVALGALVVAAILEDRLLPHPLNGWGKK